MTILPNFTYLCKPLCGRLELMPYIIDFIKWNQIVPYVYSRKYQQLVTNINSTSCNIQIIVLTLKKNKSWQKNKWVSRYISQSQESTLFKIQNENQFWEYTLCCFEGFTQSHKGSSSLLSLLLCYGHRWQGSMEDTGLETDRVSRGLNQGLNFPVSGYWELVNANPRSQKRLVYVWALIW